MQQKYSRPSDQNFILDIHAFDAKQHPPLPSSILSQDHDHLDEDVKTIHFDITQPQPINIQLLERWLQILLWEKSIPSSFQTADKQTKKMTILRLKGIVTPSFGQRAIIQGVQELYDIQYLDDTSSKENRVGDKLVIIGKGLDKGDLEESLKQWMGW